VRHTNSCFFTMVALDANGKPTAVPPLEPKTREQRRRFAQAEQRRRIRAELEQRYKALRESQLDG
jgi:acyl-CoA hydrolase